MLNETTAAPKTNAWNHRHLLDVDDFTPEEFEIVFSTADAMSEILSRPIKKVPALRGQTVVNLFYENSTRTRASFEIAAKNLSADVLNVTSTASSITKGESLIDTLKTLEALGANIIVMRHNFSGAPYLAAKHSKASIINAGDGWHAHPTQALLDLYTIRKHKGSLAGLKATIVGDVRHSRVAHSNIWGMTKLGMEVTLCGPPTLLPYGLDNPGANFPKVRVENQVEKAVANADVVMALRLQRERQQSGLLPSVREYVERYQITSERLKKAAKDVLVMHPGPVNEDIELATESAYGEKSVINEQVSNGVAIRMAILYLLSGRQGEL
ncbi:aspartate carbamoyltransferase catalytic subunit [Dehalogenimonas formicexedens]|uniref:Aspartate carbamoyltransferase n=1 Tax=Dehalogenimonas formicexedens TaxID=1839801 RepID=A0A1P8F8E1_9CHLR|nr:aspartate carbamoyltransferase catalytic subunit [Dehalogenimonas formicexedens]APV44744.1 aspartate carbamoyltransferase catalytic subunit [Dehalogenimonas formicexedens]